LPAGWSIRSQNPITLRDSEPEPDLAIVRGTWRSYKDKHPEPDNIGMIIEVADSSLPRDTGSKKEIYARSGIDIYWVVNLPDRVIEVFSDPNGSSRRAVYRQHQVFTAKQRVPIVLKGKKVGTLLVSDVLP